MEIPGLAIFVTKAETLFKSMLGEAEAQGISIGAYSIQFTDKDIQQQKVDALNKIMKWPRIELLIDTLTVNHFVKKVPFNQAKGLFSDLTYSISSSNVEILTVVYQLKYKGDLDALHYTVNHSRKVINASVNGGGNLALFFYSQQSVEEFKDPVKKDREALTQLILQNQRDVDDYFNSKKDVLLDAINRGFDLGLQRAQKHKKDNDSLL